MQLVRHVLVPTDFSPAAEPALETARLLAIQNDAKLTLAHVCETRPPFAAVPAPGADDESDYERELRESLVTELRRIGEERLAEVPQANVALVNAPSPATGICEYAKSEGVDMIVMGTHGRSGLVRFLIGSVTEKVVRYAPCPVLVIRSRPPE